MSREWLSSLSREELDENIGALDEIISYCDRGIAAIDAILDHFEMDMKSREWQWKSEREIEKEARTA